MKIWDIRKTTSTLGLDASHIMPFVQAISGCDKTSPMFGMDQSLFKILNEIRLREHAMITCCCGCRGKDGLAETFLVNFRYLKKSSPS
jgi:hypothetical protein